MEEMLTMSHKEAERAKVLEQLLFGQISPKEAAEKIGVSTRHCRRLLKAYKTHGLKGLVSKRRGKVSNRRLDCLLQERVLQRIKERYCDFGPTLAWEKLLEIDGYRISLSSVRRLMIKADLHQAKQKKDKKIHPRRVRRSRFGELIQIDASHHDWLEGRGPKCTLIVFIDDSTSALVGLRFAESETLEAYFLTMASYMHKYGRPQAFYSDKHSIFRVNHGSQTEAAITQFARACKHLDIKTICANSPQAKGRVERANGTLQDRLVKELRLSNISNINEANTFLEDFRHQYNKRFAIEPADPCDAHRSLDNYDINTILSYHSKRKVSKTLSFQFQNAHYQILDQQGIRPCQLIGAEVTIVTTLEGGQKLLYRDRELLYEHVDLIARNSKIVDIKEINPEMDRWINKRPPHRPSSSHPYKGCWKIK